MIKSLLCLLAPILLPVNAAAPESAPPDPPRIFHPLDADYPSLSLPPLTPWT